MVQLHPCFIKIDWNNNETTPGFTMDEKMIETTLENLIGRINDIKISLHNFLGKLQHEHLSWPQVLDNFALLSGQINTLNKLLSNERMPALRNLCILPIKVSMDKDDELESFR